MTERFIEASPVILGICLDLNYSRSHVAKILRENAEKLGARAEGRRWLIPAKKARVLRSMVKRQSGPRYKVGERGPNRDGKVEANDG